MQSRQSALNKWLEEALCFKHYTLTPLAGDASFRRYYRLDQGSTPCIIMDAPPPKEAIAPFIRIANQLRQVGVHTPIIHASDLSQGFMLLEDLGDNLLLNQLNPQTVDHYYQQALTTLVAIQACSADNLPAFDQAFMLQEMMLFKTWFAEQYLQLTLSATEEELLTHAFTWLSQQIAGLPQVFIHRDYHSRNIMVLDGHSDLGIIDFQDAMLGPLPYDLVSLLKDCYIQWPRDQVIAWATQFYHLSPQAQQLTLTDFIKAFEWCGLQRHLKVLGVFSRLFLRDQKSGYLKDLPLTLHYLMACLETCSELQDFYRFVVDRIKLP